MNEPNTSLPPMLAPALVVTPVVSSLISAIGFDESTGELLIQFPRGGLYAYKNVLDNGSQRAFEHYTNLKLLSEVGGSVGKYFLANIKRDAAMTFRKIEAPKPAEAPCSE